MTDQPLTKASLQQATQEFYDLGDIPPKAPREPIRRERYKEAQRRFEENGDTDRLELLRSCYEPVNVHLVAWEAHYHDIGPISPRQGSYKVDTGAVTLTCACGWRWDGPAAQSEGVAAAHEEDTA